MARFASTAALGFYPLEEEKLPLVANLFKPANVRGKMLDPFAGEGVALDYLSKAWNLEPYAIEIDEERSRKCQQKFGYSNAINDDSYDCTISSYSFPIIFNNPPYDSDMISESMYGNRRAEYRAMQYFWGKLQSEGYHLWVAYAHHMTRAVFESLGKNATMIHVYRFPGLHLEHYVQILIVARFQRQKRQPTEEWIRKHGEDFVALGRNPSEIRDITLGPIPRKITVRQPNGEVKEIIETGQYVIPAQRHLQRFQFFPRKIDEIALDNMHERFGAHKTDAFMEIIKPLEPPPIVKPIAQPRYGQLAVILAAGMLDGIYIQHEGKNAIVRGSVQRTVVKVKTETDEDSHGNERTTETYHDKPMSSIIVLSEDGKVFNITEHDKLVAFIKDHRDELMQYFDHYYKPAYDMAIQSFWGDTYDNYKVRGKYSLLPTQEQVSTALSEHLLRNRVAILVGEMSFGKAQPLDAKVLTPNGWKRMGDIKIGDIVVNPDGGTSNVTKVFTQGTKDIYRVKFNDGGETECCEDHLWNVTTPEMRWRGQSAKTMRLGDIAKNYKRQNGIYCYSVQTVAPVVFDQQESLTMNPYMLGLLLGDGDTSSDTPMITSEDSEIILWIHANLPEGMNLSSKNPLDFRIVSNNPKPGSNVVKQQLRELELDGTTCYNKFIPQNYKLSSIEDRIALLQGLLDTDGSPNTNGGHSIDFTSVSERLCDDVRELVWSLGGVASKSSRIPHYPYGGELKEGAIAYRLTINLPPEIQPFRLSRKMDKYHTKNHARFNRPNYRSIVGIEKVESKEAQCIRLDSANQLYVTDDYIVTHNSPVSLSIIINLIRAQTNLENGSEVKNFMGERYGSSQLQGVKPGDPIVILCPAIMPMQWQDEIEAMFPKAKPRILKDITDARQLFEDAGKDKKHTYIGLLSYEKAKLGEGWKGACFVHRHYNKESEYDSTTHTRISNIAIRKYAYEPVTGSIYKERNGRGSQPSSVNPDRLEQRQIFYEGPVFDGYEWYTDSYGEKQRRTKFFHAVNRRVTENEAAEGMKHYPLPMFSNKRLYGIPKTGNGRCTWDDVEVQIPSKTIWKYRSWQSGKGWQVIYVTSEKKPASSYKDADGNIIDIEWDQITTKPRTMMKRVFKENIVPDEPILDEWLAMQGVRCTTNSKKANAIDTRMEKLKTTIYKVGDGDKELDKLLTKRGVSKYYYGLGKVAFKNPRYPIAEYIAKHYPNRIGLLIVDELHKIKGISTDRGVASRILIGASKKVLALTGTIYGGVASSIYAIEFAFNKRVMKKYPWMHGFPMHWVQAMGTIEDVYRNQASYSNGVYTGHKRVVLQEGKETAGCSPLLVPELMDHCVFVGLRDLGSVMPKFGEIPQEVTMDEVMRSIYNTTYNQLKEYNKRCIISGDGSFTASFYQNMLRLPDSMHRDNEVHHRTKIDKYNPRSAKTDKIVMTIPNVGVYPKPKENRLIEILKEKLSAGKKVIVYLSQTGTRDIQDHLYSIIKEGIPDSSPFILRNVATTGRVKWIQERVDEGKDIMISNPGLVTEGVNLIMFSTIVYIEIEPSLTVMSQSSRRIWRLSQPEPEVEVHYLYYDDVFQSSLLYSIADKTAAANVLYGNEGSTLSGLSETVEVFDDLTAIIQEGKKATREEIAAKFNASAYNTSADYTESSWFAPLRREPEYYFGEKRKAEDFIEAGGDIPEGEEKEAEKEMVFE